MSGTYSVVPAIRNERGLQLYTLPPHSEINNALTYLLNHTVWDESQLTLKQKIEMTYETWKNAVNAEQTGVATAALEEILGQLSQAAGSTELLGNLGPRRLGDVVRGTSGDFKWALGNVDQNYRYLRLKQEICFVIVALSALAIIANQGNSDGVLLTDLMLVIGTISMAVGLGFAAGISERRQRLREILDRMQHDSFREAQNREEMIKYLTRINQILDLCSEG